MVKAKKFTLVKHFEGFPKETDFKLVEEELPPIKEGEFLARAIYLSIDPYMIVYANEVSVGETFIGIQVAKIIESKNTDFPVDRYVVGHFGWRNYTISNGEEVNREGDILTFLMPDLGDLPISYSLGALGISGNTAYFGLNEICKVEKKDVVVVSTAAGGTGSIAGQIAKNIGCHVIGIVGSDEKGKRIVDELKYDQFINYKKPNFKEALANNTPNGIDCYFDTVGGEISHAVIEKMNKFGRIAIAGTISSYHETTTPKYSSIQEVFVRQELKMEGFLVGRFIAHWDKGLSEIKEGIKSGKITVKETVTQGFDNMFKAFTDMLKGENFGKAIVKV